MFERRETLRALIKVKMCGLFQEQGTYNRYTKCFMFKTIDISIGGMKIIHKKLLLPGDEIEIRTKDHLCNRKCIDCENLLNMRSSLSLEPIKAKIVWSTGKISGLIFTTVPPSTRRVIEKTVWEKHLSEVRESKKVTR
jgi:c-di-GMP-binding flagellar brake protein YcgR